MAEFILGLAFIAAAIVVVWALSTLTMWTLAMIAMIPNPRRQGEAIKKAAFGVAVMVTVLLIVLWQQQAIANLFTTLKWLLS